MVKLKVTKIWWTKKWIIHPIRKKDGSLGLCCDYRKPNSKTIPNQHSLPRIQNIIDNLGGNNLFGLLDQSKACHQLQLDHNYNEATNRNNNNKNRNNKNKTNVYILGNCMVKMLNGYLLTRKIKQKNLKWVHFRGRKSVLWWTMLNQILRDIKPDHIVLHAGTNVLRTENTTSQIAKATIDLATSLKNDDNNVIFWHCSKAWRFEQQSKWSKSPPSTNV